MTGGPSEEHGANKPPPTRKTWERSKGDATCPTTSQNPSHWHPSWLHSACATKKDSESEWLAKESPETNPITIKPETVSHVQGSFPSSLPSCSLPGRPFPIRSLALSARLYPRTIHFSVLEKGLSLPPGRGSPLLQHSEVWIMGKSFLIFTTFIWFLTRVNSLMCSEDWIISKSFTIFITFIETDPHMGSGIMNRMWIWTKGFPTFLTFRRFLTWVGPLMLNEVCFLVKGFPTFNRF